MSRAQQVQITRENVRTNRDGDGESLELRLSLFHHRRPAPWPRIFRLSNYQSKVFISIDLHTYFLLYSKAASNFFCNRSATANHLSSDLHSFTTVARSLGRGSFASLITNQRENI